jgi:cell division protease FtsH
MDDALGSVAYESEPNRFLGPLGQQEPRRYGEQTAREIDEAILRLVEQAQQRALAILRVNDALLRDGAQRLLSKETLDAADLVPLFKRLRRDREEDPSPRAVAG